MTTFVAGAMRPLAACLVLASALGGCATKHSVLHDPKTAAQAAAAAEDSLEVFMGKVRARSEHQTVSPARAASIEASDPGLARARLLLEAHPSAAAHRAVAREYLRLGVLDMAHEHLTAAVAQDPADAAAWDGLARIWRDWRLPNLALPDAYRALHFAPKSPVVHNTLGTVLQALGYPKDARRQYERAIELDARAAYAWTNLCSERMLEGNSARAIDACKHALQLDPTLEPARNNLALAYEVHGDHAAAVQTFASTGDPGRAAFNTGIVHLARRQYADAIKAFEEAQALRPRFREAALMARQARQRMNEENLQ